MLTSRGRSVALSLVAAGATLALAGSFVSAQTPPNRPPLVIGVEAAGPTFTANFNPFAGQRDGRLYIYEPLAIVNPYSGVETPWLGTRWKFVNSHEFAVTVRSGVKWSDGVPFTARDVAFTFNLMKKFPALDGNGLWNVLSSVTAHGDQVIFRYKTPAVQTAVEILQVPIVPEHIWSKIKDPVTWPDANPVGTGPYVLKSFTPYQYTLVKNKNYWQAGKVQVPELIFPAGEPNQVAQLKLVSGQWQWATLFLPNVKQIWVKGNPDHQYWFPGGAPVALVLNLKKAPFDNVAFRKAVAYAINRKAIVDKAEFGYVPPASQALLTLPAQRSYLDPAIPHEGYVPYAPQESKAILKAAGFKWNRQGKLLTPSGSPVTFTIQIPSGWTDWIQTSEMIAQDLGRLGMNVTVQTPQYGAYAEDQTNGSFTGVLAGAGGQPDPYWSFYYLLGPTNTFGFHSPQVSNILANWNATTNLANQRRDAYTLEHTMVTQFPVIPLFYGANWAEYNTKSYIGWPTAKNPYASGAPYLPDVLLIATHLRPRT